MNNFPTDKKMFDKRKLTCSTLDYIQHNVDEIIVVLEAKALIVNKHYLVIFIHSKTSHGSTNKIR